MLCEVCLLSPENVTLIWKEMHSQEYQPFRFAYHAENCLLFRQKQCQENFKHMKVLKAWQGSEGFFEFVRKLTYLSCIRLDWYFRDEKMCAVHVNCLITLDATFPFIL